MNKYIINNCEQIHSSDNFCWSKNVLCQDCTDCILKQIVDYCLDNEKYGNKYYTKPILEKLDIQEIE